MQQQYEDYSKFNNSVSLSLSSQYSHMITRRKSSCHYLPYHDLHFRYMIYEKPGNIRVTQNSRNYLITNWCQLWSQLWHQGVLLICYIFVKYVYFIIWVIYIIAWQLYRLLFKKSITLFMRRFTNQDWRMILTSTIYALLESLTLMFHIVSLEMMPLLPHSYRFRYIQ